ncbi:uncharacterized protein [Periplaneta americana]|uniref:uncharacterized protein n=1 Tax=Periplaneta americana TaxID=6978 RepID=UPI0037E927C9
MEGGEDSSSLELSPVTAHVGSGTVSLSLHRTLNMAATLRPLCLYLLVVATILVWLSPVADSTLTPRAPHFQYFERPKYRYPYYDENGRGKLLYGYGGSELYQYKAYSPLEGIH